MTAYAAPPASIAITVPQTRFVRFAPASALRTLVVQAIETQEQSDPAEPE